MAQVPATHTLEGLLAVEVAPSAFVVENGEIFTRTSASKWGGFEGLEILEHSGGSVEVSAEQATEAQRVSAKELADIAFLAE